MIQRRRQQTVAREMGPPLAVPLGDEQVPRQVRVIAGADVQDMDLAGRTVAEARLVAQALFGINGEAVALVDGRQVGEAEVLGAGQLVEFAKHAGSKGAPATRASAAPGANSIIEVAEDRAVWRRNGQQLGVLPLHDLVARIQRASGDPRTWQLHPRPVRLMVPRRGGRVVGAVIEMPAGPRQVRWLSPTSRLPFGPGARYETRQLSFPWVVLVIVFVDGELCNWQQAFFRPIPIESLDDELYFTNLLNVARGYDQESWVCLVNLREELSGRSWEDRVRTVTDHFWQASFNRSAETHENNSFWGDAKTIDRRFDSAAAWEAATRENPYFTLGVRWRRAPNTLGQVLARMLDQVAPWRPIEHIGQLVTLMQQEQVG